MSTCRNDCVTGRNNDGNRGYDDQFVIGQPNHADNRHRNDYHSGHCHHYAGSDQHDSFTRLHWHCVDHHHNNRYPSIGSVSITTNDTSHVVLFG